MMQKSKLSEITGFNGAMNLQRVQGGMDKRPIGPSDSPEEHFSIREPQLHVSPIKKGQLAFDLFNVLCLRVCLVQMT